MKIIKLKYLDHQDTGSLVFFESLKDIPFEIKRIYSIQGAKKGTHRGKHAHKNLKQFLFCPYGKIQVLLDDGYKKTEIILDHPQKGLLIETMIWRELVWLEDHSVLCVAASDYYDAEDYIRDYEEFKQTRKIR